MGVLLVRAIGRDVLLGVGHGGSGRWRRSAATLALLITFGLGARSADHRRCHRRRRSRMQRSQAPPKASARHHRLVFNLCTGWRTLKLGNDVSVDLTDRGADSRRLTAQAPPCPVHRGLTLTSERIEHYVAAVSEPADAPIVIAVGFDFAISDELAERVRAVHPETTFVSVPYVESKALRSARGANNGRLPDGLEAPSISRCR